MTILLYKDGRMVIDDGNPLEGRNCLDGLVACVSDPKEGDTLVYSATAGIWVPGNPLPVSITEPAAGDTLAYDEESGTWKNVHSADGGEG